MTESHPTERDVDDAHTRKVRGYGLLHRRFREGQLADAILAKWRSNGDSGQKWLRLMGDVSRGRRLIPLPRVDKLCTICGEPAKMRKGRCPACDWYYRRHGIERTP